MNFDGWIEGYKVRTMPWVDGKTMNKSDILFCNGEISIQRTGKDHDFIAVIENLTDNPLKFSVGDALIGEPEEFVIAAHDWAGLLANEAGRSLLDYIGNGKFTYERI